MRDDPDTLYVGLYSYTSRTYTALRVETSVALALRLSFTGSFVEWGCPDGLPEEVA